jgi:hypothetical protein
MKRIAIAVLLVSTPVMAQQGTYQPQINTLGQPIKCKPIGKTASGEFVYAMSCKDVPESAGEKNRKPAGV